MGKHLYGKKAVKKNAWNKRLTGKRVRFFARRDCPAPPPRRPTTII